MEKIIVITSLSKKIANEYGETNVNSMCEFVDSDKVIVYSEDYSPKLRQRIDLAEVPGYTKFADLCSFYQVFHGVTPQGYNYNYDAAKFAKKTFAIVDAIEQARGDIIIWIDADIRFEAPLMRQSIEEMIEGKMGAFMLRNNKHLCTSFMIFNTHHEQTTLFKNCLANLYRDATLFGFPIWQDAFLTQAILDNPPGGNSWDIRNLSEGYPVPPGPANVFDILFDGIGKHYKGKLKDQITNEVKPRFANRYEELVDFVSHRKPKCILEIGTWNGDHAIEMMNGSGAKQYYGIDLFEDATPEINRKEFNVKPSFAKSEIEHKLKSASGEAAYDLFKGMSKDLIPVVVTEAAFKDQKIDFIFVDGGHSIATIMDDWTNIKPLVDQGAMAVFDDFYLNGPDVSKYGCNYVINHIKMLYDDTYHIMFGKMKDPVKGGGTTQLVFVNRRSGNEIQIHDGLNVPQ